MDVGINHAGRCARTRVLSRTPLTIAGLDSTRGAHAGRTCWLSATTCDEALRNPARSADNVYTSYRRRQGHLTPSREQRNMPRRPSPVMHFYAIQL